VHAWMICMLSPTESSRARGRIDFVGCRHPSRTESGDRHSRIGLGQVEACGIELAVDLRVRPIPHFLVLFVGGVGEYLLELLVAGIAAGVLGRAGAFASGAGGVDLASLVAPLTSAGIAGVGARDAGAASGLVNTFHQLGMALGLGVLVAVSASSGHGLTSASAVLTVHVHTALTAGTVLLAASLLAVLGLILPAHLRSRSPRPAAPQPEPGTMREPARMMTSA
jgi:hypothetical protein